MDISPIDQYFELALDLPERERAALLARLEDEEPEMARRLRVLLEQGTNPDFACHSRSTPRDARELDFLHHVAVQVDAIPDAIEWYRIRFDCEVEYQDDSWALLRFANTRLALVRPSQHPPHLAIARDDAGAFGALREHRDGVRYVYIQDPWGNTIEVVDRRSLAGQ